MVAHACTNRLYTPGHRAALGVSLASGAKAIPQVEKVLSTPTAGHSPSRLGDRSGDEWGETNGPGPGQTTGVRGSAVI